VENGKKKTQMEANYHSPLGQLLGQKAKKHFFHFKNKINFFLEISALSKTLPCRPGISEMTMYTNW
jgi:hypothetical protein